MIRPTVKINNSPVELSKYETEQKDLLMLHEENAARISPVLVEELPEIIRAQALQQRPDWIDISVPREQAIALCEDGRHFYFAGTGLCAVLKEDCTEEKDLLPFRMVGLGNVDGQIVTLADSELSHPFFTPLG